HQLADARPAQREQTGLHAGENEGHDHGEQHARDEQESVHAPPPFARGSCSTSTRTLRTRRSSTSSAVNRRPSTSTLCPACGTICIRLTSRPPRVSTSACSRRAGYSTRKSSSFTVPFALQRP